MNQLHIGLSRNITPPTGGFLFIHDEVPDIPRARIFDPRIDSFNPLKDIEYKRARELSDVLYTIYPQGENTLTVRNGRRALLAALLDAKQLDKIKADEEVQGLVSDVLASPVLRQVFCTPRNVFSFNPRSVILARVNRAELGEFDALVIGLMLMSYYKGQIIIPDFGFYARDGHASLLREERLMAGVNSLSELPPNLRRQTLLVKHKEASGATYEDAAVLAQYARLMPNTNAYNEFIDRAVQ